MHSTNTYKTTFLFSFCLYTILLAIFVSQHNKLTQYDLIQYWGSARLFAQGQNPYDSATLLQIEQQGASGYLNLEEAVVLYASPIIFPFIYALNFFDFGQTKLLWLVLSFTVYYWASWFYLYKEFREQINSLPRLGILLLIFLTITFSPFYATFYWGQISFLLYFAWVSFLLLYSSRPFWAGLLLSLTLIKPHLLYLVYLLLLLNITKSSSLKAMLGLLVGGLGLSLATYLYSPNIFSWYLEFMRTPPIFWKTLNLGNWLQSLTGVNQVSIRFLPTVIICIAMLVFYSKIKNNTVFNSHPTSITLLAPLSILTTPYGWLYDCALLYPTLVYIFLKAYSSQSKLYLRIVAGLLLASVLAQVLIPPEVGQQYFVWYVLILCLLAFSAQLPSKNSALHVCR